LLSENEFLSDSILILNRKENYNLNLELVGDFDHLAIKAGIFFKEIEGLPLFIPVVNDSSTFTIVYDEKVNVGGINLELKYKVSNGFYFSNLTVNNFLTENVLRAWHLPSLQAEFGAKHSITEKISSRVSGIILDGLNAPLYSNTNSIQSQSLETIFDLNLEVNYQLNSRSSIFILSNNLLSKEYQKYIGYPVRGITLKIGGNYRFWLNNSLILKIVINWVCQTKNYG